MQPLIQRPLASQMVSVSLLILRDVTRAYCSETFRPMGLPEGNRPLTRARYPSPTGRVARLSERAVMLNVESNVYPPQVQRRLGRSTGQFPLPVLVWVEMPSGEWDHLTISSPREALEAMDTVLGPGDDADWHFVVGRLAAAVRDPAPDLLERARHALAVYAARLGVLAG